MNSAIRSVASVITGALAVLLGSAAASAQATVDTENRYPNVGAIMVWRVDDSGKPVQLLAFASGTLIRSRVVVTAGHFTAPVKAMGGIPPLTRQFASFSPMDARDPSTWIPVVAQDAPIDPHCPPPLGCDPTNEILVLHSNPALRTLDSCSSNMRRPTSSQPCSRHLARSIDPRELAQRSWDTAPCHLGQRCSRKRMAMGRQAAYQARPCARSLMKRGDSGRYRATSVSGIQAVAFSWLRGQAGQLTGSLPT